MTDTRYQMPRPSRSSSWSTSTSSSGRSRPSRTSTWGRRTGGRRRDRAVRVGQEHPDPLRQPAGEARPRPMVVDGIELTDDIRNIQEIRAETGMVFQQFNLFPHLTVLENVTLAPRRSGRCRRRKPRTWACACSSGSGSPSRRTSSPASSPAGSSNGSRSPARWRCSPR